MEDAKIYDLDMTPVNVCKFNELDSMKKYVNLFQKHFLWYKPSIILAWWPGEILAEVTTFLRLEDG